MSVSIGRPVCALAVITIITGTFLSFRSARVGTDLTVWTFTPVDATADRSISGDRARVDLVAASALDVRLSSLFMADLRPAIDPSRPDVVELEISSVGKFLRGPADDVGFLPLDGYLRRGGWTDKILPTRLVPYSHAGHVFGLPLDLHPVTLVYRRDLIDLATTDTWVSVQLACLRYQQLHRDRFSIGLPSTSPDVLLIMLQQRHVNLVDADLTLHLTDPAVVETVCWYARATAGVGRIAADVNPAPGGAAADLDNGDVAALVLADWAVTDLERSAPTLRGKLAMAALPRFQAGDAQTASWGGTMAGIPRFCADPERAWQLVEQLYLTPPAVAARWRATGVLPPLPSAWGNPMFHQPDPYFAGQRVTELYMRLSSELPTRPMTPYTTTAQNLLGWVLNRAVSHVAGGRGDLEASCRAWLADRQSQLQRLIDFDRRSGRS